MCVKIRSVSRGRFSTHYTSTLANTDTSTGRIHLKVLTALPFFMNFMFSMTKIENLKRHFNEDIIFVTYGKFVTFLVQKIRY